MNLAYIISDAVTLALKLCCHNPCLAHTLARTTVLLLSIGDNWATGSKTARKSPPKLIGSTKVFGHMLTLEGTFL